MTTKRITRRASIAASLALLASTAGAATEDGQFAVRGMGSLTCAALVEAATSEEEGRQSITLLANWIAGYLSHVNRSTETMFDAVPVQDNRAIAGIVTRICAENPDQMTEAVVATVVSAFGDVSVGVASDAVEIRAEDRAVLVRQPVLVAVQQRLAELGHLPSDAVADGVFGPQTQRGLEQFQGQRGLTVTGLPDAATLFSLFATS